MPNLASRVLKLCLQRLGTDWTDRYGHPLLVAESFVDPEQFLPSHSTRKGRLCLAKSASPVFRAFPRRT